MNRNFDFHWDHRKSFSPSADLQTSDDPFDTSQTYRGKAAFSEPETQNIKWLLDEHNGLGYYIDIHCFGGSLLHVWGDDENQSANPDDF